MAKLYQKINGVAVPLSGGTAIIDNLTSTATDKALSANQGRVLKEMIDTKGGGGSVIRITCPEDYVGNTITFAMVGIDTQSAVVGADLVVEFTSTELGTATVTNTDTDDSFSFEIDTYSLYEREFSMYGYEGWLESASIPDTFGSLNAVLQSEPTLRTLMTKHASVDYLVEWLSADADTADTILNTDLVAKWVNLRDYALDSLWAVASIKAVMDTADKYGYGEWVLKDDVWQPKGNVPIMTSDSAPYGTVTYSAQYDTSNNAAHNVFGNNSAKKWYVANTPSSVWLRYKFVNPTQVKRFMIRKRDAIGVTQFSIKGSNDGSNWETLKTFSNFTSTDKSYFDIDSQNYYLYYEFYGSLSSGDSAIWEMQFYGRELKVSVPTMTSNTEPWGEAISSGVSDGDNWKIFRNTYDSSNYWQSDINNNPWIGYDFGIPIIIKKVLQRANSNSASLRKMETAKIQGSNDKTTWTDITPNAYTVNNNSAYDLTVIDCNTDTPYRYIRIYQVTGYNSGVVLTQVQFYALDYSEHTERHWIYDHGVEVEEVTLHTQSGTTEKRSDELYIQGNSGSYNADAYTNNPIDFTDYLLERMSVGSSALRITIVMVANNPPVLYGESGKVIARNQITIPNSDYPHNLYLDLSSVNGSHYPIILTGTNGDSTITEWWLE